MHPELRDTLFIDIETVAATSDYASMDERLKTQWARKANYLRKDTEKTDDELFHERAAIFSEFGKIICIAVGKFTEGEDGVLTLKTKAFAGDDERIVLEEFKSLLEKLNSHSTKLCAHNGKEFDYPYLCRRMLINDIPLPAIINLSGKRSWDVQHYDTMEMWKFGDYKHFTSLDLLATLFNIPSSKNDMDGSMVNHVYYIENNLEKIKAYCLRDVVVLAQVFLKLKSIPIPLTINTNPT